MRSFLASSLAFALCLLAASCSTTGPAPSSAGDSRVAAAQASGRVIKVACCGDGTSRGRWITSPANRYAAQLGSQLGSGYSVRSFGVNDATAVHHGPVQEFRDDLIPYARTSEWASAKAWAPDIIVLMLGTNDSLLVEEDENKNKVTKEDFVRDYGRLLDDATRTGAKVYVCTPPKVYNSRILHAIEDLASERGLAVIHARSGVQLGPNRIHPNTQGAGQIARFVAKAIRR